MSSGSVGFVGIQVATIVIRPGVLQQLLNSDCAVGDLQFNLETRS